MSGRTRIPVPAVFARSLGMELLEDRLVPSGGALGSSSVPAAGSHTTLAADHWSTGSASQSAVQGRTNHSAITDSSPKASTDQSAEDRAYPAASSGAGGGPSAGAPYMPTPIFCFPTVEQPRPATTVALGVPFEQARTTAVAEVPGPPLAVAVPVNATVAGDSAESAESVPPQGPAGGEVPATPTAADRQAADDPPPTTAEWLPDSLWPGVDWAAWEEAAVRVLDAVGSAGREPGDPESVWLRLGYWVVAVAATVVAVDLSRQIRRARPVHPDAECLLPVYPED